MKMRGFSKESVNMHLLQNLIKGGKKSTAFRVYYQFLELWKRQGNKPTITELVTKIAPKFHFVSFSKGGLKYQVPQLLRTTKGKSIALKWFTKQRKKGLPMAKVLYTNFIEVREMKGVLVKRRDEVHRLAVSNQRFFRFMRIKTLRLKINIHKKRK